MSSMQTRADAKNRSTRTTLQGLISVVLVAVVGVITEQVAPGALPDWAALGAAAGTAVLTAVASYVQRCVEGERQPEK